MKRFVESGHPDNQPWLLPPSIDQFVGATHPVRDLVRLLDDLNVGEFRDAYRGGGRPAYDPVCMVRVIIFGMMNGVRSSRKLAEAVTYDLRYKYLARMAQPDFRTIARFRASNAEGIRTLFVETVHFGYESGLIDMKHVSVDGTRLEANAGKRKYRSSQELDRLIQKADETAKVLLEEWKRNDERDDDNTDSGEGTPPRSLTKAQETANNLKEAKAQLEVSKAKGIVLTDRDSRMMKTTTGIRPGYNAQITVDSKCQMAVAANVVQSAADSHQLPAMIDATQSNTGKLPEKTTADGGYWSQETLRYVVSKGIDAYIAPCGVNQKTIAGWKYDEQGDFLTNAAGEIFEYENRKQKSGSKLKGNCKKYKVYRCKKTGEAKWVRLDDQLHNKMVVKTSTPEGAAVYALRKTIVEPVFAHIKTAYGLRRLMSRGLDAAKTEYMLACIAHNVSKLMSNRSVAAVARA